MAWAALLFFMVMARVKGALPSRSRAVRSVSGADSSREMIPEWPFSIAWCSAVFWSQSCAIVADK